MQTFLSSLLTFLNPFRLTRREGWLIGFVLLMKIVLLILTIVTQDVYQDWQLELPIGLLSVWNRWDASHYLYIAQHGYKPDGDQQNLLAFFFGYPLFIAAGIHLGLDPFVSAFVVSAIASMFVAVLLYRLARLDGNPATAHRAVWFQFIFPTAYFLHIISTESTFLAFTLGAFLAARQRRWSLAAVLGFIATCTRMNGMLLIPALLAEAWSEWRITRRFNSDWIFAFFPVLGVLLYLQVNYAMTGNPLMFLTYQRENWHHHLDFPWNGVFNSLHFSFDAETNPAQMIGTQEFIFAVLGFVFAVVCAIKMRPSYGVWIVGNWVLVTSMDFLTSTPRYVLLFFPMFILWGQITKHRPYFYAFTVCCLLFYGLFAPMYMQGRWAF